MRKVWTVVLLVLATIGFATWQYRLLCLLSWVMRVAYT